MNLVRCTFVCNNGKLGLTCNREKWEAADTTILYSWMNLDQFGAVEPIQMDNWEVETQQRDEAKQKELQDFQKSHPSLPFTILHFSWMLKDQFGAVAEMIMDNWDWEIQRTRAK